MIDQALENIASRLRMVIGRGRVTTTNDAGPVQTMQVQSGAMETGDNRPRLAEFGLTSVAPNGSDAVYLSMAGDRTAAVVIATAHQPSRPKGLKAGETMLYSEDGKQVYLAGGQIFVQANGMPVIVSNATTVTVQASSEVLVDAPILKCTGDIIDHCNTQPNSMAEMRALYNSHTHPVRGVQSGGSTVTSDPPSQPQLFLVPKSKEPDAPDEPV